MKFEEAMKEMRKGKKVKFNGRMACLSINDDNLIVEHYRTFTEELLSINILNIMREDWEVVDE